MKRDARTYHTLSNFAEGIETFRERNKLYGNSYKTFGKLMEVLFPFGLELGKWTTWNRMALLTAIVGKLARYVADPQKGHLDSIHDAGVYCFMLEETDAEIQGLPVSRPDATDRSESCHHSYASLHDVRCEWCGEKRKCKKTLLFTEGYIHELSCDLPYHLGTTHVQMVPDVTDPDCPLRPHVWEETV